MNLIDLKTGEPIPFKINKYPDGQQSVVLTGPIGKKEEALIQSKMNSFLDVELIICANQALKKQYDHVHLYAPYFLGARSDRVFEEMGIHYLKEVICPIVNSQNFATVKVLDPHSDVLGACLNNYVSVSPQQFILNCIDMMFNPYYGPYSKVYSSDIYIVSPDAGASKRILPIMPALASHNIKNLIVASKQRDFATGEIVRTDISVSPNSNEHLMFILVDDICDGGRTFIEIVKAIKAQRPLANDVFCLVVTHGIFSAGYDTLFEMFDRIYTTNSISDTVPESLTHKLIKLIYSCIPVDLAHKLNKHLISPTK